MLLAKDVKCKHLKVRWLWFEPKEAWDAFEQYVNDSGLSSELLNDYASLEDYYYRHNIKICEDCGEEIYED
jgi:hypothetical protein